MNPQLQFGIAAVVAVCGIWATAQAQDTAPLSADELARCASQVQQLRTESPRLLADNARLDAQRTSIYERRRAIDADAAAQNRDDLAQGMALSDRRQKLNAEATAFNARIDQIRGEIAAINEVKLAYEQACAQRPYRRRDLEQLPQSAQDAMRAGLDDVQVPYIENVTPVPADAAAR